MTENVCTDKKKVSMCVLRHIESKVCSQNAFLNHLQALLIVFLRQTTQNLTTLSTKKRGKNKGRARVTEGWLDEWRDGR